MLMLRRVTGESMVPTYKPGDIIIARRFIWRVKPGQMVVVRHGGLEQVNRVTGVEAGKIFLEGDNRLHSSDSRHFGWIDSSSVVGVVVWPLRTSQRQRL